MPQIFFNSKYIGGNKELQEALDNEEEKKELLDVLSQENRWKLDFQESIKSRNYFTDHDD